MDPRIDEVLTFWFGDEPEPSAAVFARWFTRDPAFDEQCRRFIGLIEDVPAWRGTARGELALIVVLDQFSRNVYRDDPRAFARDALALEIARELRQSGRARELTFHQRMIALMPFEHAEDRAAQAECVAAFELLLAEARELRASDHTITALESGVDYARRHAVIVERFGRFPHRNAVLGRASTPEELAFLEQPGSRF
ncbi:MAG: DUF924 family protein [Kofleriaceae bacterium]